MRAYLKEITIDSEETWGGFYPGSPYPGKSEHRPKFTYVVWSYEKLRTGGAVPEMELFARPTFGIEGQAKRKITKLLSIALSLHPSDMSLREAIEVLVTKLPDYDLSRLPDVDEDSDLTPEAADVRAIASRYLKG